MGRPAKLIQQARNLAAARGHKLGEFLLTKIETGTPPIAKRGALAAVCESCGAFLGLDPAAPAGVSELWGEALEIDCQDRQAGKLQVEHGEGLKPGQVVIVTHKYGGPPSTAPYRCGDCQDCKKGKTCKKPRPCKECGFALAKFTGRVYWIEFYQDGQRRRERIGPNKEAAEQRLREVLKARTEGRHINKSADAKTKFKDLAAWYLELPEVKAKRSYDRDKRSLKLLLPFFGDKLLKDIKPGTVEAYRQRRLGEPSGRTPSTLTAPATVNRELACFKTIFSKAIKNGKAERNPAVGVRQLKENNERDRILSPEEYDRLLAHCPAHLKPVVKVAYHSGMRKSEILNLTWGKVDLKGGFIRLQADDTKTREARSIPLSPELMEMLPPGWG